MFDCFGCTTIKYGTRIKAFYSVWLTTISCVGTALILCMVIILLWTVKFILTFSSSIFLLLVENPPKLIGWWMIWSFLHNLWKHIKFYFVQLIILSSVKHHCIHEIPHITIPVFTPRVAEGEVFTNASTNTHIHHPTSVPSKAPNKPTNIIINAPKLMLQNTTPHLDRSAVLI